MVHRADYVWIFHNMPCWSKLENGLFLGLELKIENPGFETLILAITNWLWLVQTKIEVSLRFEAKMLGFKPRNWKAEWFTLHYLINEQDGISEQGEIY